MKILVAPDKFKGVADSARVCGLIRDAILEFDPRVQVDLCPMADGGDGTLAVLLPALGGTLRPLTVQDPLRRPVLSRYGVFTSFPQKTALIEMAEASGLTLLSPSERNPLETSSFGAGELVRDAVEEQDCKTLYVTLGGSATVDGGLGFLQALGARFDPPLSPGAGGKFLASPRSVDLSPCSKLLKDAELVGLTDVQNPLLGPSGAAPVYGPQKGATPDMVETLEKGLAHFEELLAGACGKKLRDEKGSGAAGGLGLALLSLGGRLRGGLDFVAETLKLEERMEGCDLILTGEGRLDDSTRQGKTVVGVSRLAKKHGIPCMALVGVRTGKLDWLKEEGISGAFPLFETPFTGDDPRKSQVPARVSAVVRELLTSLAG